MSSDSCYDRVSYLNDILLSCHFRFQIIWFIPIHHWFMNVACCCLAWWWCGIIWRDGSSIRVSECQDRVRQDKTSEDKRREWMNEGRNKETNEMKKICNFLVFIAYQMLKSYNFIISIHSFWYHSIIKIIYFNVIVSCLYEGMMAIIMKQRGTRWGHFIQKLMILMIVGIVTAWQHEDFVMNL